MTFGAALTCVVLSAAPLDLEDPALRLAAVQKWAKTHRKPQLTAKQVRALVDCVELAPVKDTGCAVPAKLCRLHEGDDGSSGTRTESISLLLTGQEHDSQPLRMWLRSIYEVKVNDCDPPEHLLDSETPEQRAAEVAAWKEGHPREYAKCVALLEKRAKADAEELLCDLVLMNACRKEAWVTCKARNLRKGVTALQTLHRFDFELPTK